VPVAGRIDRGPTVRLFPARKQDIESFYEREGGSILISIRLREIGQLSNTFDHSPFKVQELDGDARDCIATPVEEFSPKTPMLLTICLSPGISASPEAAAIPGAIQNHCTCLTLLAGRDLRLTFRYGRTGLPVGLAVLFLTLTMRGFIPVFEEAIAVSLLMEALLIAGWAAMRVPVAALIYEWRPTWEKRRVYGKRAGMRIEVRESKP